MRKIDINKYYRVTFWTLQVAIGIVVGCFIFLAFASLGGEVSAEIKGYNFGFNMGMALSIGCAGLIITSILLRFVFRDDINKQCDDNNQSNMNLQTKSITQTKKSVSKEIALENKDAMNYLSQLKENSDEDFAELLPSEEDAYSVNQISESEEYERDESVDYVSNKPIKSHDFDSANTRKSQMFFGIGICVMLGFAVVMVIVLALLNK